MKVLSISAIEFGKGFSETNIMNFKKFYLKFKELTIPQTVSEEFKKQKQQTLSAESSLLPQKGQALPDLFLSHFRITIHLSIKSSLCEQLCVSKAILNTIKIKFFIIFGSFKLIINIYWLIFSHTE